MENETSKVFENGATWLRADFHLHTKADKEFLYNGVENDFGRLYVEQLKAQNIGVGVITNLTKANFLLYVKKQGKKTSVYSQVSNFP